jgi:hypothetical protein
MRERASDGLVPATTVNSPRWLRVLLLPSLLTALPVWVAALPPLVDLPQYAAQVRLFDDLRSANFPFRDLFYVHLFTPYLFGYVIVWLLSHLVGLLPAIKIALSLALGALPLTTGYMLEKNGRDPFWAWLVLPGCYGFCFGWGFVNFLLAIPLGMVLMQVVASHARRPSLGRWIGSALLTNLLFFSHLLVLIFFGGMAGLLALLESGKWRRRLIAISPLASVLPVALAWGVSALRHETQARWTTIWALGLERAPAIFWFMLGESGQNPLIDAALLGAMLFALPLLAGGRVSSRPQRYLPLLICLLVVLFAPYNGFGGFFIHQRFAMLLVPLFLLALDLPILGAERTVVKGAAVFLGAAWVTVIALRCLALENEARDFGPVLNRMEPGKRVLSLVLDPWSTIGMEPTYLHYPVWYQALKGGVVDFNFAQNYNEPVRYRSDRRPPANHSFVWSPEEFDWDTHLGAQYDYFVVRFGPTASETPPTLSSGHVRLIMRSGVWSLFERPVR